MADGRHRCRGGEAVSRALSWGGFALILLILLPALPWSWAGLFLLLLILFLFMPHN